MNKLHFYYLFFPLLISQINSVEAHLLGAEQRGKASFYAKKFQGRLTSCGEKFNHKELTAAHRSLPFHTMVEITNLANKKSIIVRINDRGPYNRGRLIDLTNFGAKKLGFLHSGVANVKMRIVGMEGMVLLGSNELITDTGDIIEKILK